MSCRRWLSGLAYTSRIVQLTSTNLAERICPLTTSRDCDSLAQGSVSSHLISHSLAQESVCGSFLSHVSFEQDEETRGGRARGGSQPARAGGSSQPGPTHVHQLMHKPGMQKPMFGDSDSDDDEVLDLGTFGAGAGGGSRSEGISLLDAQGRIGLRVVDTAVKPHLLQALQGLKEELQELKAPLLEASREAAAQELEASRKHLDFFAADNSAAAETDKTKVSQDTVTHAVLPPGGGASMLPTVSLEASLVILPNNRGVNICQNTAGVLAYVDPSLELHAQPCTPGTPSPVQPAILTSMGCGEARKLMQRLTPRVVAVTPVRQLLGHWERRAGLDVLQEDARGGRAFVEEERNKCLARGYTRRESIVFRSVLSEK
jgi:hypothetical protein